MAACGRTWQRGPRGGPLLGDTRGVSVVTQSWGLVGVLAVAALLLRWKLPSGERDLWQPRVDIPLALGAAAVCTTLALGWLTHVHMGTPYGVCSSDFGEHCQSVVLAGQDIGDPVYSRNRSRIAGWMVSLLGEGPLGALLNSALLSFALLMAGLFAWARALHGRLAGCLVVSLALAIGPITLLARTLSFYPLFTAVFVLLAASVALLARRNDPPMAALTGAMLGCSMLLGLRGLLWFLPLFGASVVLCLGHPWKRLPYRLLALVIPVFVSFQLGSVAYAEDALSLERLINSGRRFHDMGFTGYETFYSGSTHFVWGRSPLMELPATVHTLLTAPRPSAEELWPLAGPPFRARLLPLVPIGLAGLLASVVALRRQPRRLFALLATLLPFVVSLYNVVLVQLSEDRFLGTTLVALALVGGVGLASVVQRPPGPQAEGRPWGGLLVLVLALLVTGMVPSVLSPDASWRGTRPLGPGQREVACYVWAATEGKWRCLTRYEPFSRECVSRIESEIEAGGPYWPLNLQEPSTKGPAVPPPRR